MSTSYGTNSVTDYIIPFAVFRIVNLSRPEEFMLNLQYTCKQNVFIANVLDN